MIEDPILKIWKIWLAEYDKLKTEQTQRIGFRDNLPYVTLCLFGGTIAITTTNYYALLVVPWICLILGWTYLVNDEKISAIGRYNCRKIVEKGKEKIRYPDVEAVFG